MSFAYPPRKQLARLPTPVEPLDRLSALLDGPRIWIKRDDLTECVASGNKIRKLEFLLAEAERRGCDTLITCGGVQSNHARATALMGARHGFRVHLVLRGEQPECADGNLMLDKIAGASIEFHANHYYQQHQHDLLREAAERERAKGHNPLVIPTGASDGTGIWGYIACAEELKQDFLDHGIEPAAIVSATGSGGTQAGLTAGCQIHNIETQVWGFAVCDDADYFRKKVKNDLALCQEQYELPVDPESLIVNVNDQYIGPGYGKAGEEIFATIKQVATLEGIVLDPVYTGKAFHGMMSEIGNGKLASRGEDIVFIHTGGVFGLFPQKQNFVR